MAGDAQLSLWLEPQTAPITTPSHCPQSSQSGWVLRRSARARRISARVHRDCRVEIVVPQRAPARAVTEFIERYRVWIETKQAQARMEARPPEPFPPETLALEACGEFLRVHLAGGVAAPRVRRGHGDLLIIRGDAGNRGDLTRALQRWLMSYAHAQLGAMLAMVAGECALNYRRLSIRRQRTRWGSCSRTGTISVNMAIAFQTPQVARYLLIHELAHTRHMNHSARFWATVADHCPDWRNLDRQLRQGWKRVPQWVFS